MKCVMLGERIHNSAECKKMIFYDEMTRGYGNDENRVTLILYGIQRMEPLREWKYQKYMILEYLKNTEDMG